MNQNIEDNNDNNTANEENRDENWKSRKNGGGESYHPEQW